MYKSLIFIYFLTLIGCATTNNNVQKMNTWLGHNAQELVQTWGYPTRSLHSPNGNLVYAYDQMSTGQNPTFQIPSNTYDGVTIHGATLGGEAYTLSCTTFFEVDNNKTIIFWTRQGNDC